MSTAPSPSCWSAFRHPAVWIRAAKLGLVVGLIQVSLNQGNHWLHHRDHHQVHPLSLLSFGIAFASASAAATHVDNLHRSAP